MLLLNAAAKINTAYMLVTLDVSHEAIFWLNVEALANTELTLVIRVVTILLNGTTLPDVVK